MVNGSSTPAGVAKAAQSGMVVDSGIRLENFRTVWRAKGLTPSAANERYGRSVSFWSDLLNGRKSFGEKLARSNRNA